jgi:hypothetical protein
MLLLSQGYCFIQSLHFSYELQEDSVQNSNQSVQFPCIHSDAHLSKHHLSERQKLSVRMPMVSRSCKVSGRKGKSSERYSEFENNPVFKCICLDYVTILSGCHSVFDK